MENFWGNFPRHGKYFSEYSTLWKFFRLVFHSMENFFEVFPRYGKLYPQLGKRAEKDRFQEDFGCFLRAAERSTRRPLCAVARDRPRGRGTRGPTKEGSALSRTAQRVRRRAWPVSRPRGRGFLARSGETGAVRAQRGFTPGLLIFPRGLRDPTAEGRKA
jgi:hypothetical protein